MDGIQLLDVHQAEDIGPVDSKCHTSASAKPTF